MTQERNGPNPTVASEVDRSTVRILIMAGGASSRFFPVNKVFADPIGSGRTMIQQAKDRVTCTLESGALREFVSPEQFYVVTGASGRDAILEQLELNASNVLVEPGRRNTWPAILWAMAHLRRESVDNTVAILTADHVICDVDIFRKNLADAIQVATDQKAIVTIGIEPSDRASDWMALGAIQSIPGERAPGSAASRIERFEEKPTEERASEMIREEGWVWNAGMFVFRVSTAERALEIHQPRMFETYTKMAKAVEDENMAAAADAFHELPSKIPHPIEPNSMTDNSIDFAIMMPLTMGESREVDGYSVPARFPWTDIGSWDALRQVLEPDGDENICVGDVEVRDTRRSILFAEPGRRITTESVEGLVVVHAADGTVLVTRESEAPGIKPLVAAFQERPAASVVLHESRHCLVSSDQGRVGVHGVENVEIIRKGVEVLVKSIDERTVLERLCRQPIALSPTINNYAWGGDVLPGFLGTKPGPLPTSEAWLTSAHPDGEATLEAAPLSLAAFIEKRPEVLGHWSRKLFGDTLPIFVKFLSTRFPDKVHVGFRPGALTGAREKFSEAFTAALEREQNTLRRILELLDPDALGDQARFESFRECYERWAVTQAEHVWSDLESDSEFLGELESYLRSGVRRDSLSEQIRELRENRAWIIGHFNEIDLREQSGNLLLLQAGVAHAIFGLSHQGHPRDHALETLSRLYSELRTLAEGGAGEGALEQAIDSALPDLERRRAENTGAPKNEAWLPFEVDGSMLLVEPQQTSNTTYSWLDAYTPLVYREGRVAFRKGDPASGVSRDQLELFVREIDMVECDPATITMQPVEIAAGRDAASARLYRLIDDTETWPYFTVHRVDLDGSPASGRESPVFRPKSWPRRSCTVRCVSTERIPKTRYIKAAPRV